MKKRVIVLLLGTMLAMTAVSCGNAGEKENQTAEGTEQAPGENTEESVTAESAAFDISAKEHVTLCDYSAIPVTITGDYEEDDADVEQYYEQMITSNGPYYEPDETRDVIGEGDIVNVDYVGKLDGEAFQGGTAENQNIDVYNNSAAGGATGYIEGFTEGLKGASVGDVIDHDVTFPEDYGNQDLAGKAVVFTFTVNSIQKEITADAIDDAFVKEKFGAESIEEMKKQVRTYLENTASYNKQNDTFSAIQKYLLDNCTVEVPQDFLAARVSDYRRQFIESNCGGDESQLETYLSTYYGKTAEEIEKEWSDGMEDGIALELIMGAIAEELGTTIDEEKYAEFLKSASANSGYESEEAMFKMYGYGDVEYGKEYVRKLYLYDQALNELMETAKVTVEKPEENAAGDKSPDQAESVDGTENPDQAESVGGTESPDQTESVDGTESPDQTEPVGGAENSGGEKSGTSDPAGTESVDGTERAQGE